MIRLAEHEQGGGTPLYQLKITLKWSKPAIWRRVLVRANTRLDRLHDVIQRVMPWTDSHLHQFIVGQIYYGVPDPECASFGSDILNEKRYRLADLAPTAKKRFVYEYDFGDGWLHEILVEKILPPDTSFKGRFVWREPTPVLRRTAVGFTGITICSTPWGIASIRTMRN